MDILVKHVDNYISSTNKDVIIPKYLVYKVARPNTLISCHEVYGEIDKNRLVKKYKNEIGIDSKIIEIDYDTFINNI